MLRLLAYTLPDVNLKTPVIFSLFSFIMALETMSAARKLVDITYGQGPEYGTVTFVKVSVEKKVSQIILSMKFSVILLAFFSYVELLLFQNRLKRSQSTLSIEN